MLLAHKVASEMTTQAEILCKQALTDKECKVARLREIGGATQVHLEQYEKDQVMLKQIDADKQKVHTQKLQVEAGKREAVEWKNAPLKRKKKGNMFPCSKHQKVRNKA